MATQHVDGLQVLVNEFVHPPDEVAVSPPVEGIDDKTGEEEVVDGKACAGHFLVQSGSVLGMDLRQQHEHLANLKGSQGLDYLAKKAVLEAMGLWTE